MENYRYHLDKSSKKYRCPKCGKMRFVRFIDTSTGNYLPPVFGRCDREANCNYFYSPNNDYFFAESKDAAGKQVKEQVIFQSPITSFTSFIPNKILQATLVPSIKENIFYQNLLSNVPFPFTEYELQKVADLYKTGTITKGDFTGAITFPFIDAQLNVRAIQVKQFDNQNHTIKTSFIHAILKYHYKKQNKSMPEWLNAYQNQEKKVSCLFGEHILPQYPNNPVALVEAPKTCLYATLYFGLPDASPASIIWLGVYNLSSLTFDKIQSLAGRQVILFPDLSKEGVAFAQWTEKSKAFSKMLPGTNFIVSDLLEKNSLPEERVKGLDLADFIISQDWRLFRKEKRKQDVEKIETPERTIVDPDIQRERSINPPLPGSPLKAELWDITNLEDFFKIIDIPKRPLRLNEGVVILNPGKFVQSHFNTVKSNNGKRTYESYLNRLIDLKKLIQNGTV